MLSATKIQQEALNAGLANTKDELTEADKAMTAYRLILEGSADAIGDVARSQGSYAYEVRRLNANIDDLKTEIGKELLPVFSDMLENTNQWISDNDELLKQRIPEYVESFASGVETAARFMGNLAVNARRAYIFSTALMRPDRAGAEAWRIIRGETEEISENLKSMQDFDLQAGISGLANVDRVAEHIGKIEDAWRKMEIKGPRFEKPDSLPAIITPDMISDYESIFQQTRTPLENLYSDLGRINEMWAVGAFGDDKDTYYRAIEMYGEKFSATFDTVKNEAGETFAYMTDAFSGWAVQYSSELNNMLWDAEFSFKRIAESFGRMITEMMIQKQMMRLSEGISSWVGGLFASEHGNVFSGGYHVEKYARGGIVDKPTIFPMANGAGLMGEAGAEAIMPLTRIGGDLGVKAQTGPQNVRIEIHNDSVQGLEVTEARSEFDAQGMIVSLWIDAYQRNKGGLRNAIGG
jgi:hypothetical protein